MASNLAVSVIMPVYNAERHLRDAIASVLGQTIRNLELICVDDGSIDASPAILAEEAVKDPRLRVISQSNSGAGAARNRALDVAAGEYIAFMDADDVYPSDDVLERLCSGAMQYGLPVARGRMEMMLPDGRIRPADEAFGEHLGDGVYDYRRTQFDWGYTCCVFARQLLNGRKIRFPEWRRNQDPPFLIRAMASAGSYLYLDCPVYRYRKSYRKVDWSSDDWCRLCDMLQGLCEEVRLSESLGLLKLGARLYDRANKAEYGVLLDAMRKSRRVLCAVQDLDAAFGRNRRAILRPFLITGCLPKILPLWHYEHPILRVLCLGDKGPKIFWTIRAGGFRLLMKKLWHQLVRL